MAGLYDELKRRNVFRVAVAYVGLAWLIFEAGVTLAVVFPIPNWANVLLAFSLVLGFPIALFLAWAYELTPEGMKKETEVDSSQSTARLASRKLDFIIIGVLVLALGYFILKPAAPPPVVAPERRSIAVLPFVNMSDDPGNEYFSDGISEEILNLLASIPDLKIIGRTSSFAFKGKNEDLRVIGQTLGASTVLEGSVRKSGEQVRITAQLIDVSDGSHIWSDTYDRTMTDLFAVQDDVATAIINALQIKIGEAPSRGRPTGNPQAYLLGLEARAAINANSWWNAEKILLEATELDPRFAEAFEMLAYTYWGLAGWAIEAVEVQKLVSEAAAKAIAIDPDRVLAKALYQSAIPGPGIRARKLQGFEKAARKQPDNPWILDTLIYSLTEHGYLEESLPLAERYVELDPLSAMANIYWSAALYAVGRTEEAIAVMEFVRRLNVSPNTFTWTIDGIDLVEKRYESAIPQIEAYIRHKDSDSSWVRELVTGAGDPATGQAYLDHPNPQIIASMSDGELTSLYLFFGFLDRHFERILETKPSDATWHLAGIHIWRGNIFRRTGFTAHPKYIELVKSLGIDTVWEQRGPPDFCEKVNDNWVCE
jgi:TolB-like protein